MVVLLIEWFITLVAAETSAKGLFVKFFVSSAVGHDLDEGHYLLLSVQCLLLTIVKVKKGLLSYCIVLLLS
jgi:hypothetical protein